jgi:hypothetical protein
MLSLEMDPKLAWAVAHPERFPVDLNSAPRELLLRVPGLGVKAVDRLLLARRVRRLRAGDLKRLHVPHRRVLPFVVLADHRPAAASSPLDKVVAIAKGRPCKPRCSDPCARSWRATPISLGSGLSCAACPGTYGGTANNLLLYGRSLSSGSQGPFLRQRRPGAQAAGEAVP